MALSKVKPEETYPAFFSEEGVVAVSKRFGLCTKTLKYWWESHFGKEAYAARVAIKLSEDERKSRKKAQRTKYYISNKESILRKSHTYHARTRVERAAHKKLYYTKNLVPIMLKSARVRAIKHGVPCEITLEDLSRGAHAA